ncbi:MAG: GIN domain-containing protein [Candidatus Cryptobacteroides sp.]
MKIFIKMLLAYAFIFSVLPSKAQTKDVYHDFSMFTSLNIRNFEVYVEKSENFGIKLSVDELLERYVEAYVKNKTLYVSIDFKDVPRDIRRIYKGKNVEPPILRVTVFMGNINEISLSEGAVFSASEQLESDRFDLKLYDNSKISGLMLNANTANIVLEKKSSALLNLNVKEVTIKTYGASNLKLNHTSEYLSLDASNYSSNSIIGDGSVLDITAGGTSQITLQGNCKKLNIEAKKASMVNALELSTNEAKIKQSGSSVVTENASDKLTVEMDGSSFLYFNGEPVVKVISIKSSSLLPYESKKR